MSTYNEKIKINELQEISEVSDSNLMVIQDDEDTKRIDIKTLKEVFSNNSKINNLEIKLVEMINTLRISMDDRMSSIENANEDIEKDIETLQLDISSTDKTVSQLDIKVNSLDKNMDKAITNIVTINSKIAAIEEVILSINSSIASINAEIELIKDDVSANSNDIELIRTNIQSIETSISNIQDIISNIDTTLGGVDQTIIDSCEELRLDIMKYIEFYHHVEEYPPNFDDPGSMDYTTITEVIDTLCPVGSVLPTTSITNPSTFMKNTEWENITGIDFTDGEDIDATVEGEVSIYLWKRVK